MRCPPRLHPQWDWGPTEGHPQTPPSAFTSYEQDPNPVLGRLFGPDGEVLLEIRQRPAFPIGFAR